MNLGESILFATIMTLMEEINSNKFDNSAINAPSYNNDFEIEFTFDHSQAKDKLIKLANKLFSKADEACGTFNELDAEPLITALINSIIFECVDDVDTDYESQKEIYEFALNYCNIQSEFTWDALHIDDGQLASVLNQLSEVTLDTIFVASTKGNGDTISTEFIKLIAELTLYLEDVLIKQFPLITLTKRPPLIAFDKIIAAMEKEMRRLEEEDPSLKEQTAQPKENGRVAELRNDAHEALNCEDINRAGAHFREILKFSPDDWEATLYSEICALLPSSLLNASNIPNNTLKISNCIVKTIPLAKNQVFLRTDLAIALTDVVTRISKLATNYFVASMDAFKASFGGSVASTSKTLQVSGIINMLFVLGDTIEETFDDDQEMIKNLSVVCWETGFVCYENCNMPAPPKMYEHYLKMQKYEPSFRCSKPLTSGFSTGYTGGDSANRTGGCYIATAVYGSYDCPQVWTLRRYRDYSLAKSCLGRSFIRFYYATSPTLVKWLGHTNWFNAVFRKLLDKFTKHLISNGFENTPYVDGMKDKAIK